MRIGKERKSPGKTDVPKLYAYNECEHSVHHICAVVGPYLLDLHLIHRDRLLPPLRTSHLLHHPEVKYIGESKRSSASH